MRVAANRFCCLTRNNILVYNVSTFYLLITMLKILDETTVRCPFCMQPLSEEIARTTYDGINYFEGGKCQCGAVVAYDQSGHALGQAYEDALVFACNGDFDKAFSLVPDEDYKQQVVDAGKSHRSVGRIERYQRKGRTQKTGAYYFIKLIDASKKN